jgi:solute carrier family 35 (UDP-xylose/UDP-N-acetylglucosamine transporter), member B4
MMFFIGPWCGNMATAITNADFYPVFLVVRSCGSVSSMIIGYLFAGKKYTIRQVIGVLVITIGAGVTTLGCYHGSQNTAAKKGGTGSGVEITSDRMFIAGLGLLLLNLINDSSLGVIQVLFWEEIERMCVTR